MPKVQLTQKDLSLLNDLMSYEKMAAKKCQVYGEGLTDQNLKNLIKTMEDNHNKNFQALFNLL